MNYLIFISILSSFIALILHPIKAEIKSFGFDLLHHDSMFSPFYNQSMTESELSRKSFLRSLNRLKQFNSSMYMDGKFIGSTDLANAKGDYLMNMYIGNRKLDSDKPKVERDEPIKLLAYPSLSDYLTWVQCSPCTNCEYQHKLVYDPKMSDTYLPVDSTSRNCYAMKHTNNRESNVCKYRYPSSNRGFDSNGVLSTETFFLKSPDKENKEFKEIVFGCDDKHGVALKNGVQAVVGLGPGWKSISLVSQLGKTIGEKFSYCLVRRSLSHRSKIMFGSDIELYNGDQKYKAEIYSHNGPFYYLNLESITVNSQKITVTNKHFMRLDIQTAATTLPPPLYDRLLAEFIAEAGGVTPIKHAGYGTCFSKMEFSHIRAVPELKFHFTKAAGFESVAEFQLHSENFLMEIDHFLCLTIVPKEEPVSVLGNRAQVDIQMIFDPPSSVLTFSPLDCTRLSA